MPKRKSKKRILKKNFLNPQSFKNILGVLFVILGMLFLYKIPVVENPDLKKEPITASSEFKKTDQVSPISRIVISKVNIDLPVIKAKIVGSTWETSESTASHGEGSASPGISGNVVVFAHAREGLFYNLKDVKKGDVVYILTRDRWYRYKVNEIKNVYPKDVATIAPTKKEILTLFTCSGFFDEKRLIVKAVPLK